MQLNVDQEDQKQLADADDNQIEEEVKDTSSVMTKQTEQTEVTAAMVFNEQHIGEEDEEDVRR